MMEYWIEERKHHNWFETIGKTSSSYDITATVEHLNENQKDRFIKFVRELCGE